MKKRSLLSFILVVALCAAVPACSDESGSSPSNTSQNGNGDQNQDDPDAPGKDDPDAPGQDDPDAPGQDDPDAPGKDDPDAPGKDDPNSQEPAKCASSACKDETTLIECVNGVSNEINCVHGCDAVNGVCAEQAETKCEVNSCKDALTLLKCVEGKVVASPCEYGCDPALNACKTSSDPVVDKKCTKDVCKDENTLSKCEDGTVSDVICKYGCDSDACSPAECMNEGVLCADGKNLSKCEDGFLSQVTCKNGCADGACISDCTKADNKCLDDGTFQYCSDDGSLAQKKCDEGFVCRGDGVCVNPCEKVGDAYTVCEFVGDKRYEHGFVCVDSPETGLTWTADSSLDRVCPDACESESRCRISVEDEGKACDASYVDHCEGQYVVRCIHGIVSTNDCDIYPEYDNVHCMTKLDGSFTCSNKEACSKEGDTKSVCSEGVETHYVCKADPEYGYIWTRSMTGIYCAGNVCQSAEHCIDSVTDFGESCDPAKMSPVCIGNVIKTCSESTGSGRIYAYDCSSFNTIEDIYSCGSTSSGTMSCIQASACPKLGEKTTECTLLGGAYAQRSKECVSAAGGNVWQYINSESFYCPTNKCDGNVCEKRTSDENEACNAYYSANCDGYYGKTCSGGRIRVVDCSELYDENHVCLIDSGTVYCTEVELCSVANEEKTECLTITQDGKDYGFLETYKCTEVTGIKRWVKDNSKSYQCSVGCKNATTCNNLTSYDGDACSSATFATHCYNNTILTRCSPSGHVISTDCSTLVSGGKCSAYGGSYSCVYTTSE